MELFTTQCQTVQATWQFILVALRQQAKVFVGLQVHLMADSKHWVTESDTEKLALIVTRRSPQVATSATLYRV